MGGTIAELFFCCFADSAVAASLDNHLLQLLTLFCPTGLSQIQNQLLHPT